MKDRLTVTISPSLVDRIKRKAVEDGRSVSNMTEVLIKLALKTMEEKAA